MKTKKGIAPILVIIAAAALILITSPQLLQKLRPQALQPGETQIFYDNFQVDMGKWTTSTSPWSRVTVISSLAPAPDGDYVARGDSADTMETVQAFDLTPYSSVSAEFYWALSANIDPGDKTCFDVYSGGTWNEQKCIDLTTRSTLTWYSESISLPLQSGVKIRFRQVADVSLDFSFVDAVLIKGVLLPPPTTTITTTTTSITTTTMTTTTTSTTTTTTVPAATTTTSATTTTIPAATTSTTTTLKPATTTTSITTTTATLTPPLGGGGGGGSGGRFEPPPALCDCTIWVSQSGDTAFCPPNNIYETRECNPIGCANATRCIQSEPFPPPPTITIENPITQIIKNAIEFFSRLVDSILNMFR